jgi:hypothetical protein
MGAGVIEAAASVAVANARWRETIERGSAIPHETPAPVHARRKCPGCGSWELSATKLGPVCSYCRVPALAPANEDSR